MTRFNDNDEGYRDRIIPGHAEAREAEDERFQKEVDAITAHTTGDKADAQWAKYLTKHITIYEQHLDQKGRVDAIRDGFNVWACVCGEAVCTGWRKGDKSMA